MHYKFRKITIITGEYGCGKTNLAVNMSIPMREYGTVAVIDMDIVNPYFRTADFTDRLKKLGIDTICPEFANTNLDLPSLNYDIERIIRAYDYVIIDVGGGDAGAFALGRYRHILNQYADNLEILYVFSMYRAIEPSAEHTVKIMREIESACSLKCTALVNNSNLGPETTDSIIEQSEAFAAEVSSIAGLPVAFRCVPEKSILNEKDFPVRRMVKTIWE